MASSFRKMPQQNLSDAEIESVVGFLRWVSEIENHHWPPQDSEVRWKSPTRRLLAGAAMSPGAALVNQESCLSCHALGSAGERKGPRLGYIATRRDVDYITRYLANPEEFTPGASMPHFDKLSEAQRLPPPART